MPLERMHELLLRLPLQQPWRMRWHMRRRQLPRAPSFFLAPLVQGKALEWAKTALGAPPSQMAELLPQSPQRWPWQLLRRWRSPPALARIFCETEMPEPSGIDDSAIEYSTIANGRNTSPPQTAGAVAVSPRLLSVWQELASGLLTPGAADPKPVFSSGSADG
mmetsp:Transcript_75753/g.139526  ORF Transcript_75753/g.139526 Transcript_75753/m.139526 type:complete len:163 (+) Transcript_75753:175-663(+)